MRACRLYQIAGKSRALDLRRARTVKTLVHFLRDEPGATDIEYGLIAAGISLAIIAVVNGQGTWNLRIGAARG
jgi:pilus assembly protein Flp/PilA